MLASKSKVGEYQMIGKYVEHILLQVLELAFTIALNCQKLQKSKYYNKRREDVSTFNIE